MISIGPDGVDPPRVTIGVGTAVTWRNADRDRHRIRADDAPVEIDSEDLEPGESFTMVMDVEGSYAYQDRRRDDDARFSGVVEVRSSSPDGGAAPATQTPAAAATARPGASGDVGAPQTGVATEVRASILDRSFSPPDVTVAAGGTVTWTNTGDRDHTVTFRSGPQGSGVLSGGASFSVTPATAGTYSFFCAIHPEMAGTLTVVSVGGPASTSPVPPTDTTTTGGGEPAAWTPDVGGPRADDGPAPTSAAPPPRSSAPPPGAAAPTEIAIVDFAFEPQALEVEAGREIVWTNNGRAPHTVTGSGLDSGFIEAGVQFRTRPTSPGTLSYQCALHPQMTGTIRVVAASSRGNGEAEASRGRSAGVAPSSGDGHGPGGGDGSSPDDAAAGPEDGDGPLAGTRGDALATGAAGDVPTGPTATASAATGSLTTEPASSDGTVPGWLAVWALAASAGIGFAAGRERLRTQKPGPF